MTDDIQKVREAYAEVVREVYGTPTATEERFLVALAKRLQPKPEPPKKVWSVSEGTAGKYLRTFNNRTGNEGVCYSRAAALNVIAPDIIRERPDLVAAEWERRDKEAAHRYGARTLWSVEAERQALFPELDP